MAAGKAGNDSGKAKQKAVSRSARAGLQFPVGRWCTVILQSGKEGCEFCDVVFCFWHDIN